MSKQIKDYPKWVQEIVIKRQIEQGNKPNLEVKLDGSKSRGNFSWSITSEKKSIWVQAYYDNLKPLADFHGIKIDENGEEVVEGKVAGKTTKQKIKDGYNQGYRDGFLDAQSESIGGKDISEFDNAENYYNQTFKTK